MYEICVIVKNVVGDIVMKLCDFVGVKLEGKVFGIFSSKLYYVVL